jgi:hypothetical protein
MALNHAEPTVSIRVYTGRYQHLVQVVKEIIRRGKGDLPHIAIALPS